MLTVTDELWITAVRTVPTSVANSGFFRDFINSTTSGTFFISAMPLDMVLSPVNRMPNPTITSANFLTFSFLLNIMTSTPHSRITGAAAERLRDTSWEVMVVPMLAPKITPAA